MGEITLQQALEEFKTVHMPARNLGRRTRIEYANDLKGLIEFLSTLGVTKVGELSTTSIDHYLARLDELGLSGSTRKRKAITFRTFLSFLFRNGYISHDISKQVILPFSGQHFPRVLTQTEYQRLLEACSTNIRDTTIITLFLQTGIRLSELTQLTLANVHLPEAIYVIGRGSRQGRTIPLNTKACEALQAYLSSRPASNHLNIFLNKLGQPLGSRGVEKIIDHYYRQAGIFGASVHSLRHTFGTHHAAKGTKIETIQKIMGHKDRRTTEIYISLAKDILGRELEENAL